MVSLLVAEVELRVEVVTRLTALQADQPVELRLMLLVGWQDRITLAVAAELEAAADRHLRSAELVATVQFQI
jgi:hypothetical protein